MEQSIIMIPMYDPNSGAHAAIARVRFADGHAQVEARWSGFGQEEPQALYLLTDAGIRAVRNNRTPFSKERLIGIASMTHQGVCACCGSVRGLEKEFERMLMLLRMRYHDQPVGKTVAAAPERAAAAPIPAAKTQGLTTAASGEPRKNNVREMARALEAASQQKEREPAAHGEAQAVSAPLYGHEPLRAEPMQADGAAPALEVSATPALEASAMPVEEEQAPPAVTASAYPSDDRHGDERLDDEFGNGFDDAFDGDAYYDSLIEAAAPAHSSGESIADVAETGRDEAAPVSAPLFGHEALPVLDAQPAFSAQSASAAQDGAWAKVSTLNEQSNLGEVSGEEPLQVVSQRIEDADLGDGGQSPFDGLEPYCPASAMYLGDDEEAAPANSQALERILKKAQSIFPEGDAHEASALPMRPDMRGAGKRPPPCAPKPPPGAKPPRPPGHRPPPNPPRPHPPHPGPRPPTPPHPPHPGPRPPTPPHPPHPGPRPPTHPDIQPLPFVLPQRTDNPFPKQFPGSSWIRVQRLQGQGFYLEGRMRREKEVIVITAVPGEYSPVPPRHLQGFTRYIQTKNGGYWVRIKEE